MDEPGLHICKGGRDTLSFKRMRKKETKTPIYRMNTPPSLWKCLLALTALTALTALACLVPIVNEASCLSCFRPFHGFDGCISMELHRGWPGRLVDRLRCLTVVLTAHERDTFYSTTLSFWSWARCLPCPPPSLHRAPPGTHGRPCRWP